MYMPAVKAIPQSSGHTGSNRTYRKEPRVAHEIYGAVHIGLILIASWPHARMRNMDISLTATFTNHHTTILTIASSFINKHELFTSVKLDFSQELPSIEIKDL